MCIRLHYQSSNLYNFFLAISYLCSHLAGLQKGSRLVSPLIKSVCRLCWKGLFHTSPIPLVLQLFVPMLVWFSLFRTRVPARGSEARRW